jgi:hypothetical protein
MLYGMKPFACLPLLAIVCACASSPSSSPAPRLTPYEAASQRIEEQYGAATISDDAPYAYDEMAQEDSRLEFAREVCGLSADRAAWRKADRAACEARYGDTFNARLQERYFASDGQGLGLWCKAHPVECRDNYKYEAWARKSHNERLATWREMEQGRLNEWERQRRSMTNAQAAQALSNIGQTLQRQTTSKQPVRCWSQAMPGGVATDCR